MASIVSIRDRGGPDGRYDGRYNSSASYYPGTYIDDGDPSHGKNQAYRTYGGKVEYGQPGYNYYTTQEPFNPEYDYYKKELDRPYYYRDNRLYYRRDPVKKQYDGAGKITVTVVDDGEYPRERRDYGRYRHDDDTRSVRSGYPSKDRHGHGHRKGHDHEREQARVQKYEIKRETVTEEQEVGFLVEHLASFDVGDDDDENSAGANIESAIETLRNMDQDGNILPLRCYLTHKEEEIQVLSDKELTVLEWIKYDDINLVSAEVHQLTHYEEILLIQVKEVIHLFCPCGDLSAEDLAINIKEKVTLRRENADEQKSTHWEEDRDNNRYLLNGKKEETTDVDFYDKYETQLYGRATRDYVARNDKELTVVSGERVQIQSTRGRWWLARTSKGKSGYVPSSCLESYVPRPAGLPRTTLGEHPRDDTYSDHGSVYTTTAQSEVREGRHEHHRRDQRYADHHGNRRNYDAADGRPGAPHGQQAGYGLQPGAGLGNGLGANGLGAGLGANGLGGNGLGGNGFGANGLGAGLSAGQNGLGAGLGLNGNGLGTAGLTAAGMYGNGLLNSGLGNAALGNAGFGNAGFGNAGLGNAGLGNAGFGNAGLGNAGLGLTANGLSTGQAQFQSQTFPNAAAAGLFPPGFTAQLQSQMANGNNLLRPQQLQGTNAFGTPGLGAANLGAANLGAANFGAANFGAANLRTANFGAANLRTANFGAANLGAANLGAANLGQANFGAPNLGAANLGAANFGAPNLGAANFGASNLGGAGGLGFRRF